MTLRRSTKTIPLRSLEKSKFIILRDGSRGRLINPDITNYVDLVKLKAVERGRIVNTLEEYVEDDYARDLKEHVESSIPFVIDVSKIPDKLDESMSDLWNLPYDYLHIDFINHHIKDIFKDALLPRAKGHYYKSSFSVVAFSLDRLEERDVYEEGELKKVAIKYPKVLSHFKSLKSKKDGDWLANSIVHSGARIGFFILINFEDKKGETYSILPEVITVIDGQGELSYKEVNLWEDKGNNNITYTVFDYCSVVLLNFLTILNCENTYVTKEEVPSSFNAKRQKKGKVSYPDYNVVRIKKAQTFYKHEEEEEEQDKEKRKSPRPHTRRRHLRRYKQGFVRWIPPVIVGGSNPCESEYII